DLSGVHAADSVREALAKADGLAKTGKDFAAALAELDRAETLVKLPPPPPPPAETEPAATAPEKSADSTAPEQTAIPTEKKETDEEKKEREKFRERWEKLEPGMKEVEQVLSDRIYGDPPRGRMAGAAAAYKDAKDKSEKAEEADDYAAGYGHLDALEN